MIERAVFSYFNAKNTFANRCGFTKYSDFLYTTALAIDCASKHFKEVVMVSDKWGVNIFRKIGVPVTEYSDSLESIRDISTYFWAYGKLMAYAEQEKPFVHLDNDVFLWDPLPKIILKAELCFQSHEPFDKKGYHYYGLLKKVWEEAKVRPQKIVDNEVTDFAYNCGICGGNNLEFFKEWIECSKEYIFAPENQKLFFEEFTHLIIHQNLFHEQYFAASLIKMHGMRDKVEVISEDVTDIPEKLKYTHLWGTTKRDFSMMRRVNMRLQIENPELHKRVKEFCTKNNIE
jgi:hypothetical protein